MKRAPAKRHPDLFEDDGPPIVVPSGQKQGLVRLIRTMLMEIEATTSAPMAKQGGDDDEDHA
ncbi:MAG: hypothetical protein U1E81_10100 [Xanthobacteraceae bacterium]